MGWDALNLIETVGAFVIALSVLIFLVNIIYTHASAVPHAGDDPWDGRSLEWSIPSPPPDYNFAEIPDVEARDDWWHRKYTEDADGRLVRLPSGGADDGEGETVGEPSPPPWPRRPARPTSRSPTHRGHARGRERRPRRRPRHPHAVAVLLPAGDRRSACRSSATPRCSARTPG